MRVLIADDEPLMAESLRKLLELLGHQVAVAAGPAPALEHLGRQPVDLLLLDWLMPDGGGQRVLRALTGGEVPATRVVLMTGNAGPEAPGAGSGIPILRKPFRLGDLQAVLATAAGEGPCGGPAGASPEGASV